MSAKETVVPYGDDAAPYDNDDLSAFADQVRHDYGWCFDSDRAQAARWLATVDALRAERDEAVAKWNRAEYDADKVRAERDRAERERDAAVALLADARKCVSLVNANGYYDNWLARCARVIERSAP